jgi:hypothetical protein
VDVSQRRLSRPSLAESSTTCPDRARHVGQRTRPGSEVNVVTRAEFMPCRITPLFCRVDCPTLNYWMLHSADVPARLMNQISLLHGRFRPPAELTRTGG